ncbi:MAG: hypothetical protein ACE5JB_08020 [bacterium]
MINKITIDAIPFLATAILGLIYVYFFIGKDPVLLVIFGLQTLRGGIALRVTFKSGKKR